MALAYKTATEKRLPLQTAECPIPYDVYLSLKKRILLFYKQIKYTSFADQAIFYLGG